MVVRKLALALLVVAACRTSPSREATTSAAPMPGAPAPRAAVESFLAAVRAQDLQAMSLVWGSSRGPARDIIDDRAELEKRELVMQCYLNHDKYRILNDVPGDGGARVFRVELVKGDLTRATDFRTVRGPSDRWYVLEADLNPVTDLCKGS
jgi:hypothetical protein